MPDWNYQTIVRPFFRRIDYSVAQGIAFGTLGRLGRFAIGRQLIQFLGHASPPPGISVNRSNWNLPAPVALGSGVDFSAQATSALCLFGFGLIEVGPIDCTGTDTADFRPYWRDAGIAVPVSGSPSRTAAELATSLQRQPFRNGVTVLVRLVVGQSTSPKQWRSTCRILSEHCDGVTLQGKLTDTIFDIARDAFDRVLIVQHQTTSGVTNDPAASLPTADGILLEYIDNLGRGHLQATQRKTIAPLIRGCRENHPDQLIIVNCGASSPRDGLHVLSAGADMVMVDSGLAAAGPGLPKRINSAVRASRLTSDSAPAITQERPTPVAHRSWFWCFLLGLSLTMGGCVAVILGWTRVVLPYDEEFLGMLRDEICGINKRLLPFMSHDRVTLAGTMLALGPLYISLAWFGDRHGFHWSRVAILASSFIGFLSFFLFLGFGYFDPFHAFIAAILFQFMTLALRSSQPEARVVEFELENSSSWKRALWGQLLMICQGAAILTGGLVISSFGITTVFVQTDLDFMGTTRDVLVGANPRLIPLVAHDRATFGGMLMSTGVAVLLSALWGWQRGRRWLWYSLMGCGTVAYTTTILIHWVVGYTDHLHLLPAYGGLATLWLAMALCRDWMFEHSGESPQCQ